MLFPHYACRPQPDSIFRHESRILIAENHGIIRANRPSLNNFRVTLLWAAGAERRLVSQIACYNKQEKEQRMSVYGVVLANSTTRAPIIVSLIHGEFSIGRTSSKDRGLWGNSQRVSVLVKDLLDMNTC
jgi:hypothetical protein